MKFRALIATALTAGLLVSTAQVALADTTLKSGTLYCGTQKVPVAYTYGYGHFFVQGPGKSGKRYLNLGGTTFTRETDTGAIGGGGYWSAGLWGTGAIDTSSTGAYCSGT